MTPFDQDGLNDAFNIFGIQGFPGSRVVVYNRWGNIVYENDNYGQGALWSPTEDEVSEGTYYYTLDVNKNGGTESFSGIIVVMGKR